MMDAPKESIVFKFSSNIITHDGNCSLKYIDSDKAMEEGQYELSCTYFTPRRSYFAGFTYREILNETNREKILNKGYKLPDKSNPIIKLAPNK